MIATIVGLISSAASLPLMLAGVGGVGGALIALIAGARLRGMLLSGGIGLLVMIGAYHKGGVDCRRSHELAAAEATIAAVKRQRDAFARTIIRQNQIEARYQKEKADDDAKIAELERTMGALGDSARSCPRAATADELRRIEAIGRGR